MVNFISSLGFSIVLPFLVFLVTKFGGNAFVYGILGAVYPAFQFIGAPILGKWSDIYGRKKILLLSEAGTFLGWCIFVSAFYVPLKELIDLSTPMYGVFILTLPLLIIFAGRALDGITGGNISVANAYLADITSEKERNKNFGKMSVSMSLGFIVGPALSGLLGSTKYGEIIPVYATLLISFLSIFVILFFLPDSRPKVYKEVPEKKDIKKILGCQSKESFDLKNEDNHTKKITLKEVLKIQFVPYLLLLYFLIFLGFNFFYTAFPIHVVQNLGWSLTKMGIFFSVLSFLMVMVQGPLLSFLSKKFSDSKLIIAGSVILGTNFVLLYFGNMIIIYIAAVFFALGNGLMWPSFLSLLSKAGGSKFQGSVQGIASSMGSLASIVGLIGGGIIYTKLGSTTFIISAFIIYFVFILSFSLPKIEKVCT